MSIEVTDAAPEEAEALARILGDWLRGTGWMPVLHSREDDIGFLRRMIESHRVLVARRDGAVLGFLGMRQGDIAGFYVAEGTRRQGVGKLLLDVAKATEARLALWTFQANIGAISFYKREGFVEFERTDGAGNEEKLPDVRMIWRRPE